MSKPPQTRHRFLAIGCFVIAAVLAGGAFASAYSAAGEGAVGDAVAAAGGQESAGDAFSARVGLAVQVLGTSIAREAGVEQAVPADADAAPVAAPRPTVERGAAVDGASADLPVAAALTLDAGIAERGGTTVEEGARAEAQSAVVEVVPATPGLVGLAAIAATAVGALAWFWPSVKEAFARFVLAPFYARVGRAELFENDVREALFNLVKSEPGISASELAKRLTVSWGTTIYHLDVLEQNRMVVSVKDGRYRRYFENGAANAEKREAVSVLRNAQSASVAETVRARPGLTQKELARSLGLSPQALHWHAERLLKAGVVRKEREGRTVRFFAEG